MATQVTNYKCPACTGPLHYVGESGMLECDYCGSKYTAAEIEALYAEKEKAASEAKPADSGWGDEAENMRAYSCPSCGAELICDVTTAATSCPYCGNPTVVPAQFSGTLKPDYIIPFKLGKDAAIDALKRHYKKKPLLPRAFSEQNHLEEVQGVYVPFWLYDGEGDVDAEFEATSSSSYQEGKFLVTETRHFHVERSGSVSFERVPVDASTKMPDEYMDSIEPYDYGELRPFSTAYLPGYLADRYDVSAGESAGRADARCRESCIQAISSTVLGYDSCVPTSADVRLHSRRVKYAMMPVWMLHTKWNGKDYLFSMNGQTGKLTGDLPVSMGRFWAWFAGIFVPLAGVMMLLFV